MEITEEKKQKAQKRSVFHKLMSYIYNHHKASFIIAIISVVISAVAGLVGTLVLSTIIDDYITPMSEAKIAADAAGVVYNADYSELIYVILIMAAIYAVGLVCTLLFNKLMVKISQGCLKEIRDDMFAHMQTLPIKYFDTHTFGDIMSHYTNDTDTLRQFISQALAQLISCIVTSLASLIIMLVYSWQLAMIVIGILVVDIIITILVSIQSTRHFARQQTSIGNLNGYIEEMLGGQKVVKVFNHEKQSEEGFKKVNDDLCYESTAANTFANSVQPCLGQTSNLLTILIAFIGGFMMLGDVGGVTIGLIISFLSLSKSFSMPLLQVGQQVSLISQAMAGAKRIFGLLDEEPEVDDGYVTLVNAYIDEEGNIEETSERTGKFAWKHFHQADQTTTYTQLTGDIRMYDVDFGYTEEKIVLHNITLYAEPGQKVAFVGATGAGKTTITNLLNRFYDIEDGKIRFDGININKIKKADLRRSIGLVLQDTNLFTDTVMENIRYGRLDATDEECIEAAKLAGADEFIMHLPDGYQTVLAGAGESLSQGQRQLLNIARAAVADPPVMILDEATSSIDTHTEKIVQQGMDHIMQGRSTFVIAHRLSTIRNSDVIMVLDHGRIIERGTHDQLIDKKGTYYQLYTGAFELE